MRACSNSVRRHFDIIHLQVIANNFTPLQNHLRDQHDQLPFLVAASKRIWPVRPHQPAFSRRLHFKQCRLRSFTADSGFDFTALVLDDAINSQISTLKPIDYRGCHVLEPNHRLCRSQLAHRFSSTNGYTAASTPLAFQQHYTSHHSDAQDMPKPPLAKPYQVLDINAHISKPTRSIQSLSL